MCLEDLVNAKQAVYVEKKHDLLAMLSKVMREAAEEWEEENAMVKAARTATSAGRSESNGLATEAEQESAALNTQLARSGLDGAMLFSQTVEEADDGITTDTDIRKIAAKYAAAGANVYYY